MWENGLHALSFCLLKELGLGKAILRLSSVITSLLVLSGDSMFQAQRIVSNRCRPVILHGYGGAKKEMPTSLAKLAKSGWIPLATAMMCSSSCPPLCSWHDRYQNFCHLPCHLKKVCFLLSQWIRLPRNDLHIMHDTNSWLQSGKVNPALGSDCDDSPHTI